MKSKSQKRFLEVISHIESNIENELDVDRLCQLTHMSRHHFHRQCSAFFGVPVMSLVKRLRLKRAAYQLAYRDQKRLIDIALENGYESHEAFSRTFKKYFGTSPSAFRKSPDWNSWHSHYEPVLHMRSKIMTEQTDYQVEIVDFPEISLATMIHRGAPELLGKTISRFIQWRKMNKLPPSKSRTFNLVYDDPAVTTPENYRFGLGCEITGSMDKHSDEVVLTVIPAGKCAVLRHNGSDDALEPAIQYLYSYWLQNSDYTVRDFPLFLERITLFPEVTEDKVITDIYLPVQPHT